jgi:ABC-type transporter Mla MlaB component
VTISVFRTATPTWPGQGRQIVLVLAGDLRVRDWSKIARAIAEAENTGVDRIVLDLRAVRSCDREALGELVAVRGRRATAQRCLVDVVGVRAVQFADAVDREPSGQRRDLRGVIGELRRPWTSVAPSMVPAAVPLPRSPADGPVPDEPAAARHRDSAVSDGSRSPAP